MVLTELQKRVLYPGIAIAFISIAAIALGIFAAPIMPLFLANLTQAFSLAGEIYLVGIGYGIFNDLIATGYSTDYFSKGHKRFFRAIESEDRIANSFAWGIAATYGICIPAGIVFGITAFTCNLFALPALTIFVPAMITAAAIIALGAEIFARVKKNKRIKEETVEFDAMVYSQQHLDVWQTRNLQNKTLEQKANWLSCDDRNGFGYFAMSLLGLVGLIAYTALRISAITLPVITLSIPLQLGLLALPFVALTAGTVYLFYHNTGKEEPPTISQENQLRTEPSLASYDLYLQNGLVPKPTLTQTSDGQGLINNSSLESSSQLATNNSLVNSPASDSFSSGINSNPEESTTPIRKSASTIN